MEKVYNNRYSYIRALACVGIVFLHMIYGAVTIYGNAAAELPRNISWIVVNNLYWAVPCFVMVTGALLLDPSRELTYKKLFSKYIFRVAVALLIFTVLYRVYDILMNGEEFTAAGFFKGFANFFTGGSWSHLWYLYMLIGLYLLMPFFKKITEHITIKELGYFLLLAVVFLSLVPILKLWNIGIGFGIPIASIYPFYLFCGYAISRPDVKISKWVAVVCFVLSTAALVVLTLLRWQNSETLQNLEMFFNYSSIIVILQAVSVFYLFAKKLPKKEAVVVEEPAVVEEPVVEEAVVVEEPVAEEEVTVEEQPAAEEEVVTEEEPTVVEEAAPVEESVAEELAEEEPTPAMEETTVEETVTEVEETTEEVSETVTEETPTVEAAAMTVEEKVEAVEAPATEEVPAEEPAAVEAPAEAESVVEETPAVIEEPVVEEKAEPEKKENWFTKLVLSFDGCTFGVYLVHMFLARFVLRYMGLNPYDNIPAFIGLILATIVVSYLVVWLLRKIPKVKKVL